MIDEEVGKKALDLEIKASKLTLDTLLKAFKYIGSKKYKVINGKQSLKNLNKKGRALEEIDISKEDLKSIKKLLKKDGVDFAIKKDEKDDVFRLFFKAQDVNQIQRALKNISEKNFKNLKDNELTNKLKRAKTIAKDHNESIESKSTKRSKVIEKGSR